MAADDAAPGGADTATCTTSVTHTAVGSYTPEVSVVVKNAFGNTDTASDSDTVSVTDVAPTTTIAPTTIAPTTIAPTTTILHGIPATGGSFSNTLVVAGSLLLLGGALVLVRRRGRLVSMR